MPSLLLIALGLAIYPFIILVIITGFPSLILQLIKADYPLRLFIVIYTIITTSWMGAIFTLGSSFKWYLGGAIKIQTRGEWLRIKTGKDSFETRIACIERTWSEWGGPWTAGGWGGNQLLFWRRYALRMTVRVDGREKQLAFPLFNIANSERDQIVADLTVRAEAARLNRPVLG